MLVAVLDACVLYPIRECNVLLRAAQHDLLAIRWTEQILDEARRNLIADRPDLDAEVIARRFADMRNSFDEAMVNGYEHRIPNMTNHPGDRHVLAAAVETNADIVVTANIKDFPPQACGPLGIDVLRPDQLLRDLALDNETSVIGVFSDIARISQHPPNTLDDVLKAYRSQFPLTVEMLRPQVDDHLIRRALPGRGTYPGH